MKKELKYGTIYTGRDNLEVLKELPDNSVDMIYIDPPYLTNKKWEKNGWSFDDKFDDMWDFLYFLGKIIEDWWSDIPSNQTLTTRILSYPTQKPFKLLERIICLSTK